MRKFLTTLFHSEAIQEAFQSKLLKSVLLKGVVLIQAGRETLTTSLDRCLRNFALHMAAAAALSEAPPAAGGVIVEAIVENYYCKEDAFQDMDVCVSRLGFYRKGGN